MLRGGWEGCSGWACDVGDNRGWGEGCSYCHHRRQIPVSQSGQESPSFRSSDEQLSDGLTAKQRERESRVEVKEFRVREHRQQCSIL